MVSRIDSRLLQSDFLRCCSRIFWDATLFGQSALPWHIFPSEGTLLELSALTWHIFPSEGTLQDRQRCRGILQPIKFYALYIQCSADVVNFKMCFQRAVRMSQDAHCIHIVSCIHVRWELFTSIIVCSWHSQRLPGRIRVGWLLLGDVLTTCWRRVDDVLTACRRRVHWVSTACWWHVDCVYNECGRRVVVDDVLTTCSPSADGVLECWRHVHRL